MTHLSGAKSVIFYTIPALSVSISLAAAGAPLKLYLYLLVVVVFTLATFGIRCFPAAVEAMSAEGFTPKTEQKNNNKKAEE